MQILPDPRVFPVGKITAIYVIILYTITPQKTKGFLKGTHLSPESSQMSVIFTPIKKTSLWNRWRQLKKTTDDHNAEL